MEVLAKGQLSYMILSCLSERDMYGLELIDEMKARYGREIKLPSLYSNLNRMKELKYISSYLKESTKGPKCSYSSITTAGRQALSELENEFKELAFVAPVEKPTEPVDTPAAPAPQPQQTNIFDQVLRENTNIFTDVEEQKSDESEETNALEEIEDIQEVEDVQETDDAQEAEDDLTANAAETAPIEDDYDDYFALGDDEEDASDEEIADGEISSDEETADDQEIVADEEESESETAQDENSDLSEPAASVTTENESETAEIEEELDEPVLDEEECEEDEPQEEASDEISENADEVGDAADEEISPADEKIEEEKEEPAVETQQNPQPVAAIDAGEYNQKVYAAAKDFSKNKNKRSYSENQIALALNTTPVRTEENKQESLTQLKEALINSRQGYYEGLEERFTPKQSEVQPIVPRYEPEVQDEEDEEKVDDGVFITERVDESAMPKPKKIEPARLNVSVPAAASYDSKLPAPKRNVAVDPTCKDVKAKLESLYAKAETKKEPIVESGDFEDYDDLKRYYISQEVEFKVYERAEKRPKHNTNKLKLFVSLFLLGLIGVGSALFYLIFSLSGVTKPETNFVYYLFPILAAVYVLMCFYNYKTTNSKPPSKMMHPAVVWTIFALSIAAVFLINYACGVAFDQIETYFSTILVPIYDCACVTVGLYYSQMFAYKKFWI